MVYVHHISVGLLRSNRFIHDMSNHRSVSNDAGLQRVGRIALILIIVRAVRLIYDQLILKYLK